MKTIVINGQEIKNYEVSEYGEIYSKISKKYLEPVYMGSYLVVSLPINGKYRTVPVHRIVACTYLPNPENKTEVHHINGCKDDNCVSNLEWVTRTEHIQHHKETGNWGRPSKSLYCVENDTVYPTISDAARELNINPGNIWKVLNGYSFKASGYTFRYEENK